MTPPPGSQADADARHTLAKAIYAVIDSTGSDPWDEVMARREKYGPLCGPEVTKAFEYADAVLSVADRYSDAERVREEAARIADEFYDGAPSAPFDNGGTRDGWQMACDAIAKNIRSIPISPHEPVGDVHVALGPEQIDEALANDPHLDMLNRAEAHAFEAACLVLFGNDAVNIKEDLRAAITAYHVARFGGDPGEKIEQLQQRLGELDEEDMRKQSWLKERNARIIDLEAQAVTLTNEHSIATRLLKENTELLGDAIDKRHDLEAQDAELREALKPFSDFANALSAAAPDNIALGIWCRAARAALQPKETGL